MGPGPLWLCLRTTSATGLLPKTYALPIREVIAGGQVEQEAFVATDKGTVVNSTTPDGSFTINGLTPGDADSENHGLVRIARQGS